MQSTHWWNKQISVTNSKRQLTSPAPGKKGRIRLHSLPKPACHNLLTVAQIFRLSSRMSQWEMEISNTGKHNNVKKIVLTPLKHCFFSCHIINNFCFSLEASSKPNFFLVSRIELTTLLVRQWLMPLSYIIGPKTFFKDVVKQLLNQWKWKCMLNEKLINLFLKRCIWEFNS